MGVFLGAMSDTTPPVLAIGGKEVPQAPLREQVKVAFRATGTYVRMFVPLCFVVAARAIYTADVLLVLMFTPYSHTSNTLISLSP
jgi:hypothetical protein